MRFVAIKALRDRLTLLHGGTHGYVPWVSQMVQVAARAAGIEDKSPNRTFLSRVLNGTQAAPQWLAIALVRVAEEDYTLELEEALERAARYFDIQEVK